MNSNMDLEMKIAKSEQPGPPPDEVGSTSAGSGIGAGVPPGTPGAYGSPQPMGEGGSGTPQNLGSEQPAPAVPTTGGG